MNCKLLYKNIIPYLDKNLSKKMLPDMQKHVETCVECQKLIYEVERTYSLSVTERITEYDPYFYTRLQARMENEMIPQSLRHTRFIPVFRYVVASIAIIISLVSGVLLGFGFHSNSAQSVENEVISYVDEYTKDYYIFEIEDELIETVLLSE